MFIRSNFFKVISILSLILSLSVFAFADTIRLKDGSIIKGKIISFENGQFVIEIGEGTRKRQMRFFADEIENILFDSKANPAIIKTNSSSVADDNNDDRPAYTEKRDGDSTIITVGSAPRTNPPPPDTNDDEITDDDVVPDTTPRTSSIPISIDVKVLADNTANGWTNAGWVVKKGQRIKITGMGRISLGNGRFSGPRGISTLPDSNKLIKDKPTGGLIAVIGDDNNDFIYVGEEIEFVAERDGALFLGVNEGDLNDNSGSFGVKVEIAMN